ncbi:MAG: two-component sensor histidine kinase [Acidobacteria bacterium]|nr:MAG: two-component sensor histidine kinase [Acidobacteriota bacterium]
MILRSLRWRLAIAMALIIAAVFAAAGVFSSLTVRREFDQFLVTQRKSDMRPAARVVFNARGEIVERFPPELSQFDIHRDADGTLHLTRRNGGGAESLVVKTRPLRIGDASVYFLPRPQTHDAVFKTSVNRSLIAGVAIAALLAIAVMMTLFRRVFAPVEELTRGARALADGKLDARVDVRGRDEVAELATAFNGMAEALERNEKARRNMVSDVAHELRTPLTNIRAQIEAVQDGVMVADEKWLASIEEDAALLARLVDDLQQLSLAEAGQLRLEIEEIEIAELVERAVSGLDARVEESGRPARPREAGKMPALLHDVPQGLIVRVDAQRMVQVLRNLLVNAIAHAKSTVEIRATANEIRVIDDGPGVPPEHAEKIFDRFYRADASRSRATGGTGLGLAIAKELVELHGGKIWYERPTFVIRLP